MGKARKPRSDTKIYQLPKAVLDGVNERLVNYNMSYADIVAWLAGQGYKVSQSSLSRYAFKVFESAQRVVDDLEKNKYISKLVKWPKREKFEARTFSKDDSAKLLDIAERAGEPMRAAITLASCYGLRRSEMD